MTGQHKAQSWLAARFPVLNIWKNYFSEFYVAKNLNFYYCFGALAILVLGNQMITGLWLSFFYTPTIQGAFQSIETIMRDVNYGWLLRYMHSTGASAFFLVIYFHIVRGLLYGSYQKPRELVWLLGVALFFLLLMEGFFGYLLPWGQLSYWGAQVITSLFSVIPYIGDTLVTWVRGDFAVGQPTLQRFYGLHVIGVPLLIVLFSFLHVVALHHVGSSNPDGIDLQRDTKGKPIGAIPFYPYYVMKDLLAVLIFLILFFTVVFFFPSLGGYFLEPTNAEPANPLVTPGQITPLWYMAPFYAILRAIPNKVLGICLMFSAMSILLFLPWLDCSPVRSIRYKGKYSRLFLAAMFTSFIALGYLGMSKWSTTNQAWSLIAVSIYFSYFLLMPVYTRLETTKPLPKRIT
ncbi:MAG: cytochrome b N-terminal domain-containing protein [Gammaproteobacteria bacterium]|nr:cytochrome b N-terminal domain-containing protein [Gammaproteobacteria bacterium]